MKVFRCRKRHDHDTLKKKWNECVKNTHDLSGAYSTRVYRDSEINLFKDHFPSLSNKRLLKLDLWNEAKNTRILEWCAKEGTQIYGVDISETTARMAKENFRSSKLKSGFLVGDINHLPFTSNQFDYIYTMGTIEHIADPGKSLVEISRILKPNGIAIVGVPNKLDPFLRPALVWFMELFGIYPYSPEDSFTRRKLKSMVRQAGLEVIDDTGILFMPGFLRLLELLVYRHKPALSVKIFTPAFKFFEKIERKYKWAKRHGYLIACVCKKVK